MALKLLEKNISFRLFEDYTRGKYSVIKIILILKT